MNEIVKDTIITLGGSAMAIAAVAWLARTIITHFLSKDHEAFKLKLKNDSDLELEKLRSGLRQIAYEHEVRFSRLHEKRLAAIEELHTKLTECVFAVQDAVSPFEGPGFEQIKQDKVRLAEKSMAEFAGLFAIRRIFLSEALADQIEKTAREMRRLNFRFGFYMAKSEWEFPNSGAQSKTELWGKVEEQFREKILPLIRALEKEFRDVLGSVNQR